MQSLLATKFHISLVLIVSVGGCKSTTSGGVAVPVSRVDILRPSNNRQWTPDLAVLARADFNGNFVTVRNVRDFIYQSDSDYVIQYYDKTLDLDKLQSVDFFVVPFKNTPSLAHTMLSFGFEDGDFLAVSVEARLEEGESYSPLLGALRQFELIYVIADERDLVARRTKHRDVDVYLYRTRATPEQARRLFVDVMSRANALADEPEFYDTLTNNCTTNLVRHINRLRPGQIPADVRLLLPGFSDRLAHDLGLLQSELSFEETRRRSRINELANRAIDRPDFSRQIRR